MDGTESCIPSAAVFHWADYIVLAAMLVGSCLIGLFYSWTGPTQTTSDDFLLGGSSMGTVPMALSLTAGFVTAIELLGNPAEIYYYGTEFSMIIFSFFIVIPITSYFYLPVFMRLQLTSCYEYLELRFSRFCRLLASLMYVLQMCLYTSVAVYAPALALSRVTGLNVYAAVTIVYIVCIIYSSQGGLKAVIMTDTFQAIILTLSVIAVAAIGSYRVGGFHKIVQYMNESQRTEFFILNPNPTVRHSLWSVVIGGSFYWATMFCANQASIQKYLSVESIHQARKALWTSCFGLTLIFVVNFFTGSVLYAEYKDCDPYSNKEIAAQDELLPLYIMNVQGYLRGIPGLFVAGIFAASLGTVAAAVSSLAAITIKDIINTVMGITIPDNKGAVVSKWLSLFYGLLSFTLVFVVEQLGNVLQVALSINGITGGVTLGLFTLGMICPWANSKGAAAGGVVSLLLVSWIALGSQIAAITTDYSSAIDKPLSTQGCPCYNSSFLEITKDSIVEPMWLYRISYLWYSVIGVVVTLIVGVAVSWATTFEKPSNVDYSLLSPPVVTLLTSLPNKWKSKLNINIEFKEPTVPTVSVKFSHSPTVPSSSAGIVNAALVLDPEENP